MLRHVLSHLGQRRADRRQVIVIDDLGLDHDRRHRAQRSRRGRSILLLSSTLLLLHLLSATLSGPAEEFSDFVGHRISNC